MKNRVLNIITIVICILLVVVAITTDIFGDSIALKCLYTFLVGMSCALTISH